MTRAQLPVATELMLKSPKLHHGHEPGLPVSALQKPLMKPALNSIGEDFEMAGVVLVEAPVHA